MSAVLHKARASWLWIEAFEIERSTPGALAVREDYQSAFNQAVAGSGSWQLPWPTAPPHKFWRHYLEARSLAAVTGVHAWKHLMPLRLPTLARIQAKSTAKSVVTRGWVEAFAYPFGAAAACTLDLHSKSGLTAAQMARALQKAAGAWYGTVWSGGGTEDAKLETLAGALIERVQQQTGIESARPLGPPRTVCTVIEARGTDYLSPVAEGGEVHRMLDAVCTWSEVSLAKPGTKLEKARMRSKTPQWDGHLLYATRRGRAVWFPFHFREHRGAPPDTKERLNNLGLYHRNLTMAILQTSALIRLLREIESAAHTLSPDQEDMARQASQIVGRLYGGVDTYKTFSARDQIDDYREVIDAVRARYGRGPLHAGTGSAAPMPAPATTDPAPKPPPKPDQTAAPATQSGAPTTTGSQTMEDEPTRDE